MTSGIRGWTPSRIIRNVASEVGERLERRRHARVKIELPGRYLTQAGDEYDCVTVDLTIAGVRFRTSAPMLPQPGADVIAHVRELGCLHGRVVRRMKEGFVIEIAERRAKKLAQKIAWLTSCTVEDRRLFPRVMLEGALIPIRSADGSSEIAPIVDVSAGGIAIRTGFSLMIGERLEIGEQTAIVVRTFDGGVAAKFI